MIQNPHSIITDRGTISMVRQAENLSQEIKKGFEQRDQRFAKLKKLEDRRRRQALKDSVRAIQLASSSTRSKFVADLEHYEPPLDPVGEWGSGATVETSPSTSTSITDLLYQMAHQESETMKSIVFSLREGIPVKKLLRIAQEAKQSQEIGAQHARSQQLLSALDLSSVPHDKLNDEVARILHETHQLPLPKNPKSIPTLEDDSSEHSSSDDFSDDVDDDCPDGAAAKAILDLVSRGPTATSSRAKTPNFHRQQNSRRQ